MDLKIDLVDVDGYQLKVLALRSFYQIYKYDYIEDPSLKSRPSWANQNYVCKNILWRNDDRGEIGFAGKSACRILKLAEIHHLEITNTLPAKGPGSTELIAVLSLENNVDYKKEIFFERGAYFDYHEVEMIRKFSCLSIMIFADNYDC